MPCPLGLTEMFSEQWSCDILKMRNARQLRLKWDYLLLCNRNLHVRVEGCVQPSDMLFILVSYPIVLLAQMSHMMGDCYY